MNVKFNKKGQGWYFWLAIIVFGIILAFYFFPKFWEEFWQTVPKTMINSS